MAKRSENVTAFPGTNKRELPVHPNANLFPLYSDVALQKLAQSIRENGLVNPITTVLVEQEDGSKIEMLVDGRNRLRACELAGVEPKFICIEDGDPERLAAVGNAERAEWPPAKRAIVAAKAWRLAELDGRVLGAWRPKKSGKVPELIKSPRTHFAELFRVNDVYVRDAKVILDELPEKAEEVLDSDVKLDAALQAAKDAKKRREDEKERKEREDADWAELESEAADLADRVRDETLTRAEAMTLYAQRLQEAAQRHRERLDHAKRSHEFLEKAMIQLDPGENGDPLNSARVKADELTLVGWKPTRWLSVEHLRRTADMLDELANVLEERGRS